ncbi:tyrosinase cofactor [Streptomyces sp. UNOC14_S4]|nr:tyrosinase cofactor [Streptomyces sp. UNOC14_S4]
MLKGTAVAAAGVALATPTALAATRSAMAGMDHSGHTGMDMPQPFDEVYKGRRIVGMQAMSGHEMHHGGFAVTIDGKELHVMQNADGSWISVVNHYQTFPDPLSLTRAAVDKLQGAVLVPIQTN